MNEDVAIISRQMGEGAYFARGIAEYVSRREHRRFGIHAVALDTVDFRDGEFKIRIGENIRRRQCFLCMILMSSQAGGLQNLHLFLMP
jgi:phosphoribosylpyrophosphate synthetase